MIDHGRDPVEISQGSKTNSPSSAVIQEGDQGDKEKAKTDEAESGSVEDRHLVFAFCLFCCHC